jgi:hypothetical protein
LGIEAFVLQAALVDVLVSFEVVVFYFYSAVALKSGGRIMMSPKPGG